MQEFTDFALQFHEDIYEEDDEGNILRIPPFDELIFNAACGLRHQGLEKLLHDLNNIIDKSAYQDAHRISQRVAATPFLDAGCEKEQVFRIRQIVKIMKARNPKNYNELRKLINA